MLWQPVRMLLALRERLHELQAEDQSHLMPQGCHQLTDTVLAVPSPERLQGDAEAPPGRGPSHPDHISRQEWCSLLPVQEAVTHPKQRQGSRARCCHGFHYSSTTFAHERCMSSELGAKKKKKKALHCFLRLTFLLDKTRGYYFWMTAGNSCLI